MVLNLHSGESMVGLAASGGAVDFVRMLLFWGAAVRRMSFPWNYFLGCIRVG